MAETKMQKVAAVQKRTFTRWMNHFLSERMLKVEDLFTDLKDGIKLINLLELISSKKLGKYKKKCKFVQEEVGNLEIALKFIISEGLTLVNIGASDIHAGNGKLILGLVWTLILRYQIQMGGDGASPKQELLDWVNKQTLPYRDHIPEAKNFTKSWQDGKILAALADSLKNGIIDTRALGSPVRDLDNAMALSEKHYDIPRLVDAADMAHNPDEHSNMTYVSYFRDYLENKAKIKDQAKQKGPHALNCFAMGKGVKGGFAKTPMPFTIHSRNISNQPVLGKWARPMRVKVTDPAGKDIPCTLRDNKDGTFFGKYVAEVSGEHQVQIQVDNSEGAPVEDIKGSIYKVAVREPSDPSKCWAEGPGLVRVYDDQPALFTVFCRDQFDKPVAGDKVTVDVKQIEAAPGTKPMGTVPVEVKDQGDGSYAVKYDAIVPGLYRVDVSVPAGRIKDMPKDVRCYKAADASKTVAKGPGVTSGAPRVGIEAPFEVFVKDRNGNPVKTGGHDLKITVTGPDGPVECKLVDDDTGVYKCAYTAKSPGPHVVDVKLNGDDIKDNPFKINIIKPADPAKSYAEGPGLIKAWDNKANPFKVHALDEDGKPVPGEPVEVTVTPKAGGPSVPVDVKDMGDGTYDVQYQCDKPGEYVIDTKIRGESIKDMPLEVTCYKGVDPLKSEVKGPGVEGGFAKRDLPFTVYTKDKDGKPVPVGGADITAKVVGPDGKEVPCELKDNEDGTYSGSYNPHVPGIWKVQVLLDGAQHIGKSPFKVRVRPGADPDSSFAVGKGWKQAYDALPTKFTIYAKDVDGQPVPGELVRVVMTNKTTAAEQKKLDAELDAMDDYLKQKKLSEIARVEQERKEKQAADAKEAEEKGTVLRTWTDPEGDVAVTVRDNGDGSYLAEYCAAKAGTYQMAVTLGGDDTAHIKESPKKIPVLLSKPRIVFWAHTYAKQQEELKRLRKALVAAEQTLRDNGLAA